MEFELGINEKIVNKGDPRTRGWKNATFDMLQLVSHIKQGFAISPSILKPDHSGKKHNINDVVAAETLGLDVDGAPSGYYEKMKQDSFVKENVLLMYTTPSHTPKKNHFRIMFKLPKREEDHRRYSEVARRLIKKFNADKACSDITRFFYGNTDAEVHIVGKMLSEEFYGASQNGRQMPMSSDKQEDVTRNEAEAMLRCIPPELGYGEWAKVVAGISSHFDPATATALIDGWSPDKDRGTRYKVDRAMPNINIASVIYIAKMHGYKSDARSLPEIKPDSGKYGAVWAQERESGYIKLYEEGYPNGVKLGIPGFDELLTFYPDMLTLITGYSSHGKSAYITYMACLLAAKHKWKFAIFTPEDGMIELHMQKIARMLIGKSFLPGYAGRMDKNEMLSAKKFIEEHFFYIDPPSSKFTIGNIVDTARYFKRKEGINAFVIDPWNRIRKPAGVHTLDYIGDALHELEFVAAEYRMHCFLIAHPRKTEKEIKTGKLPVPRPFDISGSADWRNMSHNCITVYRDDEMDEASLVDIWVFKAKHDFVGKQGCVRMAYDKDSLRYRRGNGEESRFPMIDIMDFKTGEIVDYGNP